MDDDLFYLGPIEHCRVACSHRGKSKKAAQLCSAWLGLKNSAPYNFWIAGFTLSSEAEVESWILLISRSDESKMSIDFWFTTGSVEGLWLRH